MKSAKFASHGRQSFWFSGAIALVCVSLLSTLQVSRLESFRQERRAPTLEKIQEEDASTKLQLEILKQLPALGFNNLIADWILLDFIQYFGDTPSRQQTGFDLSPDFFDALLTKDPYFRDAYFFLSSSTSLYAGLPERTVELIEREIEHLSPTVPEKAAYIWRYKGIDELLFLGDSTSARESFEKATEWASVYDDEEGQSLETVSRQMTAFLANDPNSRAAQVSAWVMVFYNAFDSETKQLAVQRIRNLGADVAIDENGILQVNLMPEQ
ncbi:MAG: hypothetical protein VKL39_01025 [Leptolyngbyaceae bacterium]|nr:hypothetical protein [Leptolyngbyaceae bacterium]